MSGIEGRHSFYTPKAGGTVDRGVATQVGRTLAQLGIENIAAYSPQACGRSERAFRTLEDPLPKAAGAGSSNLTLGSQAMGNSSTR